MNMDTKGEFVAGWKEQCEEFCYIARKRKRSRYWVVLREDVEANKYVEMCRCLRKEDAEQICVLLKYNFWKENLFKYVKRTGALKMDKEQWEAH